MSWSRRPGRIRVRAGREGGREGGREEKREGGREGEREGVPALVVWHGDVDELVQTPGPHQGGVDDIGRLVAHGEGGREGGREGEKVKWRGLLPPRNGKGISRGGSHGGTCSGLCEGEGLRSASVLRRTPFFVVLGVSGFCVVVWLRWFSGSQKEGVSCCDCSHHEKHRARKRACFPCDLHPYISQEPPIPNVSQ